EGGHNRSWRMMNHEEGSRDRRSAPQDTRGSGDEPPTPLVSIIIVTWNGRHHLDLCLSSVSVLAGVEFETILVDNASGDGTVDYVRERYPWVRLVRLDTNRGFAGGNNAGTRVARGRYV